MYIKSSFPGHDKIPDCNAYEALWNRREQAGWPDDLILHIEGVSGRKRTYQEFRTCAVLAATTLGTPVSDGSPGVQNENGEIIAIASDSSSVRGKFLSTRVLFTVTSHEGLCCAHSFIALSCKAVRFV